MSNAFGDNYAFKNLMGNMLKEGEEDDGSIVGYGDEDDNTKRDMAADKIKDKEQHLKTLNIMLSNAESDSEKEKIKKSIEVTKKEIENLKKIRDSK